MSEVQHGQKDGLSLRGRKVLVTGGAGVIGQELLALLVRKEACVLSVDRKAHPSTTPSQVACLQCDLALDDLSACCAFQPEFVLHLAASFERSKESAAFWLTNWHDNTMASHRLLDMIRDLPEVKHFIFASSYLIYDPSLYLEDKPPRAPRMLNETDRLHPRNVCGASKYYTEQEMEFIHEYVRPDVRMVSTRIFRVYGRGSNDIISRWIRMALHGETLTVYQPESMFDYIHAGDVASGLLALAQQPRITGVCNLGSGVARPVCDVLQNVVDVCPIKTIDTQAQGLWEASCADIGRLRQATQWQPAYTLEQGMQQVMTYERTTGTGA